MAGQEVEEQSLLKVLEDNLSSIDAERTALSPYARGALGAILRAFAAAEALKLPAGQLQQATKLRLEAAFPGAEPSEVLAALEDEREQHATLAEAFLSRVTTDRDSLHRMHVEPELQERLQAVVATYKRRRAHLAAEETAVTL